VVVWQQRPSATCGGGNNATSEIFYAYDDNFAAVDEWTDASVLTDTTATYSVDPDIVVSPANGVRHFVFMKDDSVTGCAAGFSEEFAVFYRGPWQNTANDTGEGGVFLPIIVKGYRP
jgi:hypothetical protein